LYLAVLTLPHRPLTRAIFAIAILALMTRTIVRNRDWADAATFYARTIKAAPYSASVRANLSHEFAVNGNEDRALAELLAAERLDPKYPTVKLKLAAAYMARGDRVQARAKLDECLALMPRNTAALLLAAEIVEQDNDLYRARQLLLAAMDTTSNPLPWMRYAEFLQRHHENDKALTVVRQALTLEPGNATLHNLAGILLADTGDRAGAEQEFRTATTFDRHAPDAWINLGRLAARRDQWPAALTAYQRALQIAPDSPVAGYQIAIVHWKLGDRAQAEQELRRVHDAWPENRDIGSALDRLQRGETPPELRD
jgi:Tfp pilus assembly protein PilF